MAAVWSQIGERGVKCTQAATESAPSDGDLGLPLLSLSGFALTVECDEGETFASSAGQLDLYIYDDNVGGWSLVPNQVLFIPPEATGLRRFMIGVPLGTSRGRLAFICNGLDLTGGGVTMYYSPTVAWFPSRSA